MVSASGQNLRVKARTPRKEATREFPLYGTEISIWFYFNCPTIQEKISCLIWLHIRLLTGLDCKLCGRCVHYRTIDQGYSKEADLNGYYALIEWELSSSILLSCYSTPEALVNRPLPFSADKAA